MADTPESFTRLTPPDAIKWHWFGRGSDAGRKDLRNMKARTVSARLKAIFEQNLKPALIAAGHSDLVAVEAKTPGWMDTHIEELAYACLSQMLEVVVTLVDKQQPLSLLREMEPYGVTGSGRISQLLTEIEPVIGRDATLTLYDATRRIARQEVAESLKDRGHFR